MAARVGAQSMTQEDFDIEYDSFVDNYKKMSQWADGDWNVDLEVKNDYQFVVKNLAYWSKMLKPACDEMTAILAVFKNGRLIRINEKVWMQFFSKIGVKKYFQNFYYVRNNNIIGIQFNNVSGKQMLLQRLNKLMDGYVIDLEWYQEARVNYVRVHWLPKGFYNDELIAYISKFLEILEISYEENKKDDESYPMNVVSFKGIVRFKKLEDIPHIIVFRGLQALIVVSGRPPMCIRCEEIGHKVAKCDKIFCTDCKVLHLNSYKCEKKENRRELYAEKLKTFRDNKLENYKWPRLAKETSTKGAKENKGRETEDVVNGKNEKKNGKSTLTEGVRDSVQGVPINMEEKQTLSRVDLADMDKSESLVIGANTECRLNDGDAVCDISESEDMDFQLIAQKRKFEKKNDSENEEAGVEESRLQNRVYVYGTRSASRRGVLSENLFDVLVDQNNKEIFD